MAAEGLRGSVSRRCSMFFFFQAEDGIRDYKVTGVQTCALPIYVKIDGTGSIRDRQSNAQNAPEEDTGQPKTTEILARVYDQELFGIRTMYWVQIGRASCRERV